MEKNLEIATFSNMPHSGQNFNGVLTHTTKFGQKGARDENVS